MVALAVVATLMYVVALLVGPATTIAADESSSAAALVRSAKIFKLFSKIKII